MYRLTWPFLGLQMCLFVSLFFISDQYHICVLSFGIIIFFYNFMFPDISFATCPPVPVEIIMAQGVSIFQGEQYSKFPVLRINDHATGGRRTKDILGGPKSLETKKLGSSKGWEDQSAEKTNNWKDKKYITNRWDTKKLNILLKTETTVHCEIIHLWRGNLVCMCSYPC